MRLAPDGPVEFLGRLVHLQVPIRRRSGAAVAQGLHLRLAIGLNPRAIAMFWWSTASESMPLIGTATGRLMA